MEKAVLDKSPFFCGCPNNLMLVSLHVGAVRLYMEVGLSGFY